LIENHTESIYLILKSYRHSIKS